jgi:hypothetical protein
VEAPFVTTVDCVLAVEKDLPTSLICRNFFSADAERVVIMKTLENFLHSSK